MKIAPIAPPKGLLCAHCVDHPATKWDRHEGKWVAACVGCTETEVEEVEFVADPAHGYVPDEGQARPKERFLAAVRCFPGKTFQELRELLGVPGPTAHRKTPSGHANDRASQAIARLVKQGLVVRTGEWPSYVYWPAPPAKEENACAS